MGLVVLDPGICLSLHGLEMNRQSRDSLKCHACAAACVPDLGYVPVSLGGDVAFGGRQHLFGNTAAARTMGILSCCLMTTPSSCLGAFPCFLCDLCDVDARKSCVLGSWN